MRALILIAWLIAEVWLLKQATHLLGVIPTALWLLGAVFVGGALLRLYGLRTMLRAQAAVNAGQRPSLELIDGTLAACSALLLIFPGLLSDLLALPLLIGPLRRLIAQRAERSLLRRYPDLHSEGVIIDGEYTQRRPTPLPDERGH